MPNSHAAVPTNGVRSLEEEPACYVRSVSRNGANASSSASVWPHPASSHEAADLRRHAGTARKALRAPRPASSTGSTAMSHRRDRRAPSKRSATDCVSTTARPSSQFYRRSTMPHPSLLNDGRRSRPMRERHARHDDRLRPTGVLRTGRRTRSPFESRERSLSLDEIKRIGTLIRRPVIGRWRPVRRSRCSTAAPRSTTGRSESFSSKACGKERRPFVESSDNRRRRWLG